MKTLYTPRFIEAFNEIFDELRNNIHPLEFNPHWDYYVKEAKIKAFQKVKKEKEQKEK